MKYTAKQIENAKRNYNVMMRMQTLADYDIETIGVQEAGQRMDYHNRIVESILNGDKELERKWKLFYLMEEVKKDQKEAERKQKLADNKSTSYNVLTPIREKRKLGEFGKWLNTSGNPYRKQHFNKKYTVEAVNEFLATL